MSQEIDGAVISVPAAFTLRELNFIRDAAQVEATLQVLSFIREPVAAAIAYFNAPSAEDEKTILVYDLGGGTCDVAIVRSDKNSSEWYKKQEPDIELKLFEPEKAIAFGAAIYSEHLTEETTETYIAVYESECTDYIYMPEEGTHIGEIRIRGLRDSRKDDETLLTITIDRSGLMQIKAVDKRTGKSADAEIQLKDC